jgi:flagellar hook-length control protein FliK
MNEAVIPLASLPSPSAAAPSRDRGAPRSARTFADIVEASAARLPDPKRASLPARSAKNADGEAAPEGTAVLLVMPPAAAAVPAEAAAEAPAALPVEVVLPAEGTAAERTSDSFSPLSPEVSVEKTAPALSPFAPPEDSEPSRAAPIKQRGGGQPADKLYTPGDPKPQARFAPPETGDLLTNRVEAASVSAAEEREGRQSLARLLEEPPAPIVEEARRALPLAMETRVHLAVLAQEARRAALSDGEASPVLPQAEAEEGPAQAAAAIPVSPEAEAEAQGGETAPGNPGRQPAEPLETAGTPSSRQAGALREYTGLVSLLQAQSPETLAESVPREPTVSPAHIIRQIVETTAFSQTGNISQIRLQLNPEFLGRINIVLTATPDGLTARVHAQSDAARDILSANLTQLQSELRQAGVNMKSIDVVQPGLTGQARGGMGQSWNGSGGEGNQQSLYESWGQPRPVTIARFRQMARVPLVSAYDRADYAGITGVDYRA